MSASAVRDALVTAQGVVAGVRDQLDGENAGAASRAHDVLAGLVVQLDGGPGLADGAEPGSAVMPAARVDQVLDLLDAADQATGSDTVRRALSEAVDLIAESRTDTTEGEDQ